jgi:hypothetical protein
VDQGRGRDEMLIQLLRLVNEYIAD